MAASVDGEGCVAGQAIACVVPGREAQLAREYDSAELLLRIDAQSSDCGPRDLVLVRSSSKTVEELVAELEAHEDVAFAEPNYVATLRSEDGAEEPGAEKPAEQQGDGPEEPGPGNVADPQEVESPASAPDVATRPDYANKQYAFDGEFGMGVPDWNTYDSAGNPTPSVSTEGKVVAVIDSGVDYDHEDLRNVMWSEGQDHPTLVALGGGRHGINVAMPRGNGTPYDTTDPMDDNGHGTHVAGIIAAEWNGVGVSGATCGAKIMAVKVNNDISMMSIHEAIQGYRYVIAAQEAGVDVVAINNSWNDDAYSKSLDMAMRVAGVWEPFRSSPQATTGATST
jgi:subtilisin family serine protease